MILSSIGELTWLAESTGCGSGPRASTPPASASSRPPPRLHYEQGVAATSYVQIAERAGVGPATVYRHFPTLGSLVEACGAQCLGRDPATAAGERAGRLCGPRHAAAASGTPRRRARRVLRPRRRLARNRGPRPGSRARARGVPAAGRGRRGGAGPGGDRRRVSEAAIRLVDGAGGRFRVAVAEAARRAAGGVPAHDGPSAGLRDHGRRAGSGRHHAVAVATPVFQRRDGYASVTQPARRRTSARAGDAPAGRSAARR